MDAHPAGCGAWVSASVPTVRPMSKATVTTSGTRRSLTLARKQPEQMKVLLPADVLEALTIQPHQDTGTTPQTPRLPRAVCTGTPVSRFYPRHAEAGYDAARVTCATCPEQLACMMHGLRHEAYGIWGGLTEAERHHLGTPSTSPARPIGLQHLHDTAPRVVGRNDMRSRAAASAIENGVHPAVLATALRAVHGPSADTASTAP